MDATLNTTLKILAYGDRSVNSNPRLKYVDWSRDASGIAVADPKAEAHSLAAGETKTIFDGVRSTSIDNTTEFDVTLSSLDSSRYRFSHSGGTAPAFRTDRLLTLDGIAVTFLVNTNNTVTLSVPALAAFDFADVVAGDVILIPHTTTGDDASVFSVLNAGLWEVLAQLDDQTLSLARPSTQDFEAVSETQTLTDSIQVQAFSASGVQVGDSVDISLVFATATRRVFEVIAVAPDFFEVMSTSPIPEESGVAPTTAGIVFYTDAKSFLYVEADQECAVRLNGASDSSQRLSPIEAGNADRPGIYMKRGPAWSLDVVNRSSTTLNVVIIHCE